MKALVTGATGFVGTRLCKALSEAGVKVVVLACPGENINHIQDYVNEVRYGDMLMPETLEAIGEGCDVVYHLAARVSDHGTRDEFYSSIVEGSKNIIDACAGSVNRFVYISSICAFGTGRNLKNRTENETPRKTGIHYGDAKLEAELLVKKYQPLYANGTVVVRPANVIGPGSIWVSEIGEFIKSGKFCYIDNGRHGAGLVYVDNLVDGLLRCGTAEIASGQTYFFRDDWKVTWRDYFDDLAKVHGKKIVFNIPFGVAWGLGFVGDKFARITKSRALLTRHAVGLMGRDCDVNTDKAKKELGWETNVSYDEARTRIMDGVLSVSH